MTQDNSIDVPSKKLIYCTSELVSKNLISILPNHIVIYLVFSKFLVVEYLTRNELTTLLWSLNNTVDVLKAK